MRATPSAANQRCPRLFESLRPASLPADVRARTLHCLMVSSSLYALAGGMMVILATGRPDELAWRFLRLVGFLIFGLITVITLWSVAGEGQINIPSNRWAFYSGIALAIAAMILAVVAPLAVRLPRMFRILCSVGGVFGMIAAVASVGDTPSACPTARFLIVVSQVLAALLLGNITVAWLLGHAYLTATKMTIAPLRRFSRSLLWIALGRTAFVGVSLGCAYVIAMPETHWIFPHLADSWLVVFLRVGIGLVAVGAFAYMVLDCVLRRSTQSATGILYFGSVFAYIGELASQYLIRQYGWPV